MPGFKIDLFDIAIEVFDLDQLGILIHRQHAKALVLVNVLVPLAHYGLVFSGHLTDSSTAVWRARCAAQRY